MLLGACAKDTIVLDEEPLAEVEEYGYSATIPAIINQDAPKTRAYFQYSSNGMEFRWEVNDKATVFPYKDKNGNVISPYNKTTFNVNHLTIDNEGTPYESSTGYFKVFDNQLAPLAGYTYLSCKPVTESNDYTKVPVDYTDQKQASNVKVALDDGEHVETYLTSEKDAAAHLNAKNYVVDERQALAGKDEIHFVYSYMDATVRFFLAVPDADGESDFSKKTEGTVPSLTYDKIQLVSTDPNQKFVTSATMNLATAKANPVFNEEGKETSHVVTLKLGDNGFDFKTNAAHYKLGGYYIIIAYMQMPAIDLSNPDHKPLLYLVAHDSSDNKYYFKAELPSKKILVRDPNDPTYGCAYQWSANNLGLDPIIFNVASVQEWQEATGFENNAGNVDGAGTEGW